MAMGTLGGQGEQCQAAYNTPQPNPACQLPRLPPLPPAELLGSLLRLKGVMPGSLAPWVALVTGPSQSRQVRISRISELSFWDEGTVCLPSPYVALCLAVPCPA